MTSPTSLPSVDVDVAPEERTDDGKAMTSSPAVLRSWWVVGGCTADRRAAESAVRDDLKLVTFPSPRRRPRCRREGTSHRLRQDKEILLLVPFGQAGAMML
jgi:hypothetical protein